MLKIKNLFVSVDGKEIVSGVSLIIRPGEIHALMGPNGSGKSSLAMAIAGHPKYLISINKPINTNKCQCPIELDGADITNSTPDGRARMGLFLASQYPVGVEGVTVEQLLRRSKQEIQSYKGRSLSTQGPSLSDSMKIDVLGFRKDLVALAKKVGVASELLFRSINVGFSGGEKKRLEILQMLVLEPNYAILDETDSGLDVDALKNIAEMVKRAQWPARQRFTAGDVGRSNVYKPGILVITHYAKLLHYLQPDTVHVMKEGRITESGGMKIVKKIEQGGYRSTQQRNN